MLPAHHRLRTSEQFRAVVRGRARGRAGGALLVVQVAMTDPLRRRPPRAGFVVSRSVGGAVVRNRTTRRLRALVRPRLVDLPPGCDVVVRATPAAAQASFAQLQDELERCLDAAVARVRR